MDVDDSDLIVASPCHSSSNDLLEATVTVPIQVQVERPKLQTVMGHAQPAQLTDFLEHRHLQLYLGGFLCLSVCVAILVLVLVLVLSNQPQVQQNQVEPFQFPSIPPTPTPTHLPPLLSTLSPTDPSTDPPTTVEPTSAPLLMELPLDTIRALRDPSSPQSLAYAWFLNHPNPHTLQPFQKLQIMAVLTIYYALNGDQSFWGGQFSAPKGNWGSYDVPFCQWTPFQTKTANMGTCNDRGQLTKLNLHNIQGTIQRTTTFPPEITLLTHLNALQFTNCLFENYKLVNFLPFTLQALPNLQKLQYVGNNFVGTIPAGRLANWTNLTYFSLDNNALSGPIPSQVGLLTSLQFLSLSWNSFQGTIPSQIGRLDANLRTLRLYKNRLRGPVPSQIALLTNLRVLELQNNDISGTLPTNICAALSSLNNSLGLDCHQVPCPHGCNCNC